MPIDAPTATSGAFRKAVRRSRLGLVLGAALAVMALGAQSASALPATYDGIAADGHLALFSSAEQMVPGDTDNQQDVYLRERDTTLGEYVTKEVSIGPFGGNDAQPVQYIGVSSDGNEVFFSTVEPLTAGDDDQEADIYVRDLGANATTLVSAADGSCPAQGCGASAKAEFIVAGVVPAGDRLFFTTTQKLSPADGDESRDVYMRDLEAEETVLVSRGDSSCAPSCGNGEEAVFFMRASTAGDKASFTTKEGLVAGDADGRADVYQRDLTPGSEATRLASVAGTCPPELPVGGNCDPTFRGASADGSHVFFESNERIVAGDTDKSQDVYDWSTGGAPARVSTGPSGGNGAANSTFSGTSADGLVVYFKTEEALDPAADQDTSPDVYRRSGGVTTLVSTGPAGGNGAVPAEFEWASPDDSTTAVLFSTAEALTTDDTDGVKQDVYEREGGITTLVSTGPEAGAPFASAIFAAASHEGSRVFFTTSEALVAEDEDESSDIYLRDGETTTLVSKGAINGNGAFGATPHGIAENGSKAFFTTSERLTVDDDFAGEEDVYSWSGTTTLLVSVKNSSELELGPEPPFLEGTSPSKSGQSTEPKIVGEAEAGALIKLYRTSDCSGEQATGPGGEPAGGTAAELASPGIPVAVAEGTATFYATAEVEGVVSPCSNGVTYTQENPPPPPPPPGEEGSGGGGSTGTGSGGSTTTGSGGTGTKPPGGGFQFVTPEALITFGPAAKTRKRKVVFRFSDATEQPGTKFLCRLDRKGWRECSSPKRLSKLKLGRHAFAVKAVNAVGTWDEAPAKHGFKVVR